MARQAATRFVLHGAVLAVSLIAMGVSFFSGVSLHHFYALSLVSSSSSSSSSSKSVESTILRDRPLLAEQSSRIWHNLLTEEEQWQALQRVGKLIQKYGALFTPNSTVHEPWKRGQWSNETLTDPMVCSEFGSGWGAHYLCGSSFLSSTTTTNSSPCNFISFGISRDYSFDVDLATTWNCRGFAGDPSVTHNSQLHPLVTFHNVGAGTLNDGKLPNTWYMTSLPSLVQFLKLPYVNVLKMDCEGCEYALPRDVIMEDPTFFHRVGQISLEVHTSVVWINTNETLYYLGLLFELMEEAGLELAWSHVQRCSPQDEVRGCMPQLEEWGMSCGLVHIRPPNGGGGRRHHHQVVAQGNQQGSCHNFLFARRPQQLQGR